MSHAALAEMDKSKVVTIPQDESISLIWGIINVDSGRYWVVNC